MFYEGARTFRSGTSPVPVVGAGQTLLRVRRVGICGTDLHIFEGHLDHRVPKGGVLGHETLADVVEAEAGSGFRAGERVVVNPVVSCGTCRACKMEVPYLCYSLQVLGVDRDGGLQQYWAVATDRLLRVPDSLSDDQAALIEPLAIATHDVRRAAVEPGQAVMVFGGGPIGTLIAMVCRHRGARVSVVEVNSFRLDMLRRLGLEAVDPKQDLTGFVNSWTDGEGADVAFEVTGNAAAMRAVTDVVRVRGTVSIVAIHAAPTPVNLYRMFERELVMHGSRLYAWEDWEEAIRLAAAGAVELAPLVSRTIPLEALAEGMQLALGGGPVMKVLIDPTV